MRLVVATRNEHKLRELRELLPDHELAPLPDGVRLPPETAETFEENALIKACAAACATAAAAIADDSGIAAAALGGRPGVRSARYAGEGASDEENLAKLLRAGGNVLLLDEPTNDLDVDTLRAVEDALVDFAGCAVIVSHDRWFLDRIATHILAFEGDSRAVWFEGNYQDYEADRRRRLGAEAEQPHRIKYRKLVA